MFSNFKEAFVSENLTSWFTNRISLQEHNILYNNIDLKLHNSLTFLKKDYFWKFQFDCNHSMLLGLLCFQLQNVVDFLKC